MNLSDFIDRLCRTPSEPKLFTRVPDQNVLDAGWVARPFVPKKQYFEFRLSQMFLRDRRELWRGFIPLVVAVSEFQYGPGRETVPFLVNNDLLKSIEKYISGEQVEYRDTRLAGPVPYSGDDVSLFIGLFRSQVTDSSERLWQFVESVVKAFDVTQMSRYLDIARPVQAGLGKLLDMKEVEFRVGARQVFSVNTGPDDPARLREGYLAYVNCPATTFKPGELWVQGGALLTGTDSTNLQPIRQHDHCLVRIGSLEVRDDYTSMPFHRKWENVQREVYEPQGNVPRAEKLLLELAGDIAGCVDLIPDQRYQLIRLYKANFEKDKAVAAELRGGAINLGEVTRGSAQGDPRSAVDEVVNLALRGGVDAEVVNGLLEISRNWDKIPGLERAPERRHITESLLKRQLQAFTKITGDTPGDPQKLVDALSVAAFAKSKKN